MGCFSTGDRSLVGGVFAIYYRTKCLFGFPSSLVEADLCHVPQCHAALFWADLVLKDVRSVFPLSTASDSQPEAPHVVIELNVFELALGHFELGYIGLSQLHEAPSWEAGGKIAGVFP